MPISFVAIDFETANSSRASACSLGMTKVEDGQISARKYELFKPPKGFDHFEERNISIHGIKPSDVIDRPRFGEIWGEFNDFVGDFPLVAHNASFDLSVLRAALSESQIEWPQLKYACTMVMSRSVFQMASYSLLYVAHKANISLDANKHHDALFDSEVCAKILLAIAELKNQASISELLKSLNLQMGELFPEGWYTCRSNKRVAYTHRPSGERKISSKEYEQNVDADPNHPLFGKNVVFTGKLYSMPRTDAWRLVAEMGGVPKDGMTKSTNFLVLGEQDPFKLSPGETQSGKFREAEKLREKGLDIEILSETDFLAYLEPEEGSVQT